EGLRQLIDALVSGLIEGTVAGARQSGASDAEAVRVCPARLAAFTPEAAETSRALKRFLYRQVYASKDLGAGRRRSMDLIAGLFQFFLDQPDRMPPAYAQQTMSEPAHRVVCDYIAGMTDVFFYRTYDQMIGAVSIHPLS